MIAEIREKKCTFAVVPIRWRLINPEAKLNISQNPLFYFYKQEGEKFREESDIFKTW